ncbi:ATP-binding protein [Afifella sp. H1R]|uniref:ATP-binding protein n=1 Tax=Afifella sp. H1R TaxID=2908841 RepID=UPI001F2D37D3|nr:ATP-binding protein [Afifella sp. H1R]
MIEETNTENNLSVNSARPLARLAAARLPLLATALVLAFVTVNFSVPVLWSVLGFAFVLVVTAAAPARMRSERLSSAAAHSRILWPDTGMKAVVSSLPHPAFLLDQRGITRFSNEAATAAFPQARPGDPLSMSIRTPRLRDALAAAQGMVTSRFEYRERSGAETVYVVTVQPVLHAAAAAPFILLLFEDVTERLATARMRADFVANASHELRTPLASLSGFIDTLQGPARSDPKAQDRFLTIMREQAERMRRLLDDLLSLSRLEMRVHQQPREHIDLAQIARRVVDGLRPLAEHLEVEVTLDVPDEPVFVLGDADELHQVLENLAENGLKYGGAGKRLDVRLVQQNLDGGAVVLASVRDWGPGIAPEHLPRLTERFYRVDVASSREKQGTGLGLAIVKHILTRHRGRLDIDSEQGAGATFTVRLPAAEAPADHATADEAQKPALAG